VSLATVFYFYLATLVSFLTEVEPVSSKIYDFTPREHAQSNTLHIKYAEKTDN